MGSAQDIMQVFAQKDLRARFPDENGWTFDQVSPGQKTGMIYRVSRHFRRENQYALVAMSFERKIPGDQITALRSIPRDRRSFQEHYLLVPQNADVASVPDDIGIIFMNAFGIADSRLTWLTKKKNAVKYPVAEPAAA